MTRIKAKVTPMGNSYHILIPKALITCKVLETNKVYVFNVVEEDAD